MGFALSKYPKITSWNANRPGMSVTCCISMANILLLECVKATDCPYGGINYQCVDNLCKCPSTMELVDKMCKGISTHI